jgi:hypothetical protein
MSSYVTSPNALIPGDQPRSLSRIEREAFKQSLPSAVQVQLDQPFGKDSLSHSFTADAEFRHILVFLFRSCYLTRKDRSLLIAADPLAKRLSVLIRRYNSVDFRPVRGFAMHRDYESETAINPDRVRLTTAALLHYKFDMATLVRFLGGPHVGAHRDVDQILRAIDHSVAGVFHRRQPYPV